MRTGRFHEHTLPGRPAPRPSDRHRRGTRPRTRRAGSHPPNSPNGQQPRRPTLPLATTSQKRARLVRGTGLSLYLSDRALLVVPLRQQR